VAPDGERPALKNQAQRNHRRGAGVRRLDHYNLLAGDVGAIRDFFPKALGSRITEQIVLDNGQVAGCWFTVNNKSYDVAYTRDYAGGHGRFHHITYAVDQREHVLEAADVFLENGVFIETGPHKHAIQQTFFLYVYEPAGNRVEVANAGARLILAPDYPTVTWTEAERKKGQALGPQDHRELPHPRHPAHASRQGQGPFMTPLKTLLGDYPLTSALKKGEIVSDTVNLEFADYRPTNTGFKPMVREGKFDVSEMAIVTYLIAKAHHKPMAAAAGSRNGAASSTTMRCITAQGAC
jgi:catechol 2,3-dioxygenase-like lactoylglutathione lyase family enzyme